MIVATADTGIRLSETFSSSNPYLKKCYMQLIEHMPVNGWLCPAKITSATSGTKAFPQPKQLIRSLQLFEGDCAWPLFPPLEGSRSQSSSPNSSAGSQEMKSNKEYITFPALQYIMKLHIRRAHRNQNDNIDNIDCWIPYQLRILRISSSIELEDSDSPPQPMNTYRTSNQKNTLELAIANSRRGILTYLYPRLESSPTVTTH
ncbi:hypothetical protein YC2023_101450 [Brassica napus]